MAAVVGVNGEGKAPGRPLPGGLFEFVTQGMAKRSPPRKPKPAGDRAPAADADQIAAVVKEAQDQIAAAAAEPPFDSDPYGWVLGGLSCALGVLPKVVRRQEDAVSALAVRLDGFAIGIERATARVAEVAEQAKHPAFSPDQMADVTRAAEKGGVQGWWSVRRELRWRDLTIAASAAALAVAVLAPVAFYAGRVSLQAEADARQAAVAGVTLPLDEAEAWAKIIRQNPPVRQLLAASKPNTVETSGRAVLFNVWVDPPRPPGPGGR